MGKKGGSKHLKRLPSPPYWPIHKKEYRWVVKPDPGPHPMSRCLPLLLIVRDMLGFAKTRREARIILSQGHIVVDGKVRREERFPVGLMDVVEIPKIDKACRVLPSPKGGLVLHSIVGGEKGFKLCKVIDKTTVKGGHAQLNLHDGRNILIEAEDPKHGAEDTYRTSDVLKVKIPEIEVLDHIKFGEGVTAVAIGGKNIGRWGEVVSVDRGDALLPTTVTLEGRGGDRFRTIVDYIFTVGREEPLISLPEAAQT
ncbi:MAG: 30S ribosomal protein S4e [Candidatus Bathyarchaeia archaeon]